MLFPTIQFGIYFPIVFIVSWLLRPQPRQWKLFMIAASYVFYAFAFEGSWFSWERWKYPALLGLVTVGNQVFVVGVHRAARAKKAWMVLAIAFNLGILGYFKYYSFMRDDIGGPFAGLPAKQVFLPVAISFYIFQALSYVIDAYRGKVKPTRLLDFATYLSFFPHLVAGPIVRARELLPQLRERPDPRHLYATRAYRLIIVGMFKKVVISSYLASAIVDKVYAAPKNYSAVEVLFATYAYAIQIYSDFSGYTDIAIGLALLLGIRFPKNFDSPYRSLSLQDFWRRWHMSLSRWLRDYLYIPLGGNKRGNVRTYVNLMLVMLLGGIWHGASWRFLVWGAIHGVGLAVERLVLGSEEVAGARRRPKGVLPENLVRWVVTFHVVCLAWVFFRASSFTVAGELLGRLVTGWGTGSTLVTPLLVGVIALMIATQFVPERFMQNVQTVVSTLPAIAQGVGLAVCFFLIQELGPVGVAPFIYFQF